MEPKETALLDELYKLCRSWQEVLSLEDWEIKIQFSHHYDLPDNSAGSCNYTLGSKQAVISVIYPNERVPDVWETNSTEATIIHELLHLHFSGFTDAEYIVEEQAINALTRALLRLSK